MKYDYDFKIVLLGDEGTGKKSLTGNFLTDLFRSDSRMTIGVDFEMKTIEVKGKKVRLQIWNFGGEERFKFLLPTYVRGANGALFIYDITNYSSLTHLDEWLTVIKKGIKEEDQFPIIVVGNKGDLEDEREVSGEEGIQFAKSRGVDGFIECSARTGENVRETFKALSILIINHTKKMKRDNYS